MHRAAWKFLMDTRIANPSYFAAGVKALDVGALNINGSCRDLFENPSDCVGIDRLPGRGVDLVAEPCDLLAEHRGTFDTITCAETLEHDHKWRETVRDMVQLLRPEGMLVITAASPGRRPHMTVGNPKHGIALEHYKNIDSLELSEELSGMKSLTVEVNRRVFDVYAVAIR